MTSLLLAFLAHIFSDYIVQNNKMVQRKIQKRWTGFIQHALVVLLVLIILLHAYRIKDVILFAVIISGIHLFIDYLRYLWASKSYQADFFGFIADQILHFVVILGVWQMIDLQPEPAIWRLYSSLYSWKTITVFHQEFPKLILNGNHLLIIIIVTLLTCWGGAIFIRKFLRLLNQTEDENSLQNYLSDRHKNTGYYIGIIERLIILILVTNNALTGTAFIFTAKSIARFNELNNKEFAEYYLIGTLTSTAIAICGGFILKYLLEVL